MIRGITVTLYARSSSSVDGFGAPVYTESQVNVENVLVAPTKEEEVTSEIQLYGRRSEYTLYLPKGDTHTWAGCKVGFFGQVFEAIGPVAEYIDGLVPGPWNKKVKVARVE